MSVSITKKVEDEVEDKIEDKIEDKSSSLISDLNKLLANYAIMYQNLTGLHWNIVSPHFFGLHAKYEELYDAYDEYIDQVAERIRMLDSFPIHTYADYMAQCTLPVLKDITDCHEGLEGTLEGIESLIKQGKEIIEKSGKKDDYGTQDLLIKTVGEQEKARWMIKAMLDGTKEKKEDM